MPPASSRISDEVDSMMVERTVSGGGEQEEGENVLIEKIPDPLPCDYAWTFKIQVKE